MPASTPTLVDSMAAAWNAGDAGKVRELATLASDVETNDVAFLALLAVAQQHTGECADAASTFARLTRLQPEVSAWWNNLGVACRQAGHVAESEKALLRAQSLAPHDPEVRYNLGLLLLQQRRWARAREVLLDAARLAPRFVAARLQAAHACHVCGDLDGEEAMLQGADAWPPQPADQALVLASILSVLGRFETAFKALAEARLPEGAAAVPLRLRITAQRVALYERNNRLGRAQEELRCLPLASLDALPPAEVLARIDGWRAHAAVALREGRFADAAALYRRALDAAPEDEARASAAFGLAIACDRQRRHRDAWAALGIAHAAQMDIVRQAAPKLSSADGQPLPMVTRSVDANAYATWKPLKGPPLPQSPVFVVGFPRSGTTLLEQMLDAHPDFRSMDERGYVYQLIERMEHAGQRYPAALAALTQAEADQLRGVYRRLVQRTLPDLGGRRLIDKNPLNMLCLPMIMRLFPDARIVLCLRHPCDVLLSCSMQPFRSPAFMALCSSLPRLAGGYARAFEHWLRHVEVFRPHVLTWRYESLVEDPGKQLAQLAEFIEVTDAAPMAGFADHARAKRFISTPSYAQVTEPVHGRAVGRWRAYREWFEPVLPVLSPWIERFGYAA